MDDLLHLIYLCGLSTIIQTKDKQTYLPMKTLTADNIDSKLYTVFLSFISIQSSWIGNGSVELSISDNIDSESSKLSGALKRQPGIH